MIIKIIFVLAIIFLIRAIYDKCVNGKYKHKK